MDTRVTTIVAVVASGLLRRRFPPSLPATSTIRRGITPSPGRRRRGRLLVRSSVVSGSRCPARRSQGEPGAEHRLATTWSSARHDEARTSKRCVLAVKWRERRGSKPQADAPRRKLSILNAQFDATPS